MDDKKLSKILMDGIEEMHKIMNNVGKKNFNEEEAKVKIATNNSLTTTAKTLIQLELLKVAIKNGQVETKKQEKKLLGME